MSTMPILRYALLLATIYTATSQTAFDQDGHLLRHSSQIRNLRAGAGIGYMNGKHEDEEFIATGLHKMASEGTSVTVQRLEDRFKDDDLSNAIQETDTEETGTQEQELEKVLTNTTLSVTTIVVVVMLGLFIILMFFSHEGSSIAATWDVSTQQKVIGAELPGFLPVFIPMYNESTEEVERTCSNFSPETVANDFVRAELIVYFIVDNTRDCEAVKAVLSIAEIDLDPNEELPQQLGVPFVVGKLHGIPFKMFFKSESNNPEVIKGKRFSALLFSDLVKNDGEKADLKKPWATICLDADVVTFPYSIENLVLQMLQDENITVTCGNILPSIDQTSLASRVQAAEYFLQNRIVKNAEALFGVVTCCPGAFLLMEFESFQKTVKAAFSIDTEASTCLMRNALDLGEDRFLTSLLLIHKSQWTSFLPASNCTTQVPDTFEALARQRRRWFNSSLANDIYIIRHVKQMFRSMIMSKTQSRFVAIVRFIYLVMSTSIRIIGASFSVLFSMLLMASVQMFVENEGLCTGYFCRYYAYVLIMTIWVMFLIWSFHQSAAKPNSFFGRKVGLWLNINLGISACLMLVGTISVGVYGQALQGRMMALSLLVLVSIYFFLIVNMSEHRSTFGLQLMISLVVYLIIGLPFLAFMQPIVALSQIDNFNWGTREEGKKIDGESTKEEQIKARRGEKIACIVGLFALNAFILFGVIDTIGGATMIKGFFYVFITTQFLQVFFGMIRNIHLLHKSKKTLKRNNDDDDIGKGKSPKEVFTDQEYIESQYDDEPIEVVEDHVMNHDHSAGTSDLYVGDDDSLY